MSLGRRNTVAAAPAEEATPDGFSLTPYNMSHTVLDYSTPEGRTH